MDLIFPDLSSDPNNGVSELNTKANDIGTVIYGGVESTLNSYIGKVVGLKWTSGMINVGIVISVSDHIVKLNDQTGRGADGEIDIPVSMIDSLVLSG